MLPKLHRDVKSQGLAAVVQEHLEETKEHARRLEHVFRAAGAEPSSNLSPPLDKLKEHHDEVASSIKDDRLADVFHSTAAATTEHFELASYDALLTLAESLELGDARKLLEQNRGEEAQALGKLQKERERLTQELADAHR